MDEYLLTLSLYFFEVIASEVPDKIKELRLKGLLHLQGILRKYKEESYCERLLSGIAEKKGKFIINAHSLTEMKKIFHVSCPTYNGNKFIPDEYWVPEEELIGWSHTSLNAPLNSVGFKRYMEVFGMIFPEEYKKCFGGTA